MNKFDLKLDENNELQFALSIKGTITEGDSAHSEIRFSIVESKTGHIFSFPVVKKTDGDVSCLIPSMPEVFKEENDYTGKLEIFIGSRYFNPTTFNIKFIRSLQVEAIIMKTKENSSDDTLEEDVDDSEIASIIESPKKKALNKLTDKRLVQKAVFSNVEPVATPAVSKKPTPTVAKKPVIHKEVSSLNEGALSNEDDVFEDYKKRLKSMIADAVKEV